MKKISSFLKCFAVFTLIIFILPAYASEKNTVDDGMPKVFQVTTAETLPGDAVLIRGEFLDKISEIKVSRLSDENVDKKLPSYLPMHHADQLPDSEGTSKRVKAESGKPISEVAKLQQNIQSVKFIIPDTYEEGIYSVSLFSNMAESQAFYLNVPKINWVISEEGLNVTSGDFLRVQGKNLNRKGFSSQIVLISENGKNIFRVKVAKVYDDYSISADIPEQIPVGKYHMYYHNGRGGTTAWSEPFGVVVTNKSEYLWEKKIFNVKEFGAAGDGENNETAAFRAALNAAELNGGGTVWVPRGRYMLTGELILPPHTMLKGESKELSQIFWNSLYWDTNELPNSLISGTHHFAIKDLNLWASRAWGVILSTGPPEEQGNISLENLIVRQSAQLSGMVYQVKANRDVIEAELHSRWSRSGIILRGDNIKVRNCDFNSAGMFTFFAVSGFIQNCKFERNGTGVNQPYMLIHPKGLIFEDCYKHPDGYGYTASIDESKNLYEARNCIPFNYTNDREAMTLDGGSGAYFGKIGNAKGTLITIPEGVVTNQWTVNRWAGGGVYIIEGRGTGQYRRIINHTIDSIIIDQPFLVDPDSTSIISITTVRKNLFYVNNEVIDAGAYQFYGSAQNCVISGLKMQRCNGIISRGSLIYNGKQPNWYNEIVNCELKEGNYCHWFGIDDRGHSGFQNINLIGSGGSGLNIGTLVRRNKLSDFTYIRTSPGASSNSVTDVIIEDNSINIAKNAIFLGGSASHTSNVLIHNNHYNDVEKQVNSNPGLNSSGYLILDDGLIPIEKKGE